MKVKRRNATALYRRGYYARAQLVPYNRRDFLTYSRVAAAATYSDQIRDIKVKMKASYVAGSQRGGDVIAEATIDIAPLMLEIRDEGFRAYSTRIFPLNSASSVSFSSCASAAARTRPPASRTPLNLAASTSNATK